MNAHGAVAPLLLRTSSMEVTRLLNEERPSKRARPHVETIYMNQSAALERRPRSSAAWRPYFRSTEAGQLQFECRWPSCDHWSSTVEADTQHLQSHIVRRHVFHARVVAKLRDEADAATPSHPITAVPARVLALPHAPAPAPCPSPGPPCSTAPDSDPTHQQWRTSRPRTGNRIPLDQRTSSVDASAQFKCAWPNCSYVALRRSHLMQHELMHTGKRPFGTPVLHLDRCVA